MYILAHGLILVKMAVLLEQTASYIFNSDSKVGAQNVSADGSMFNVYLSSPIKIPRSVIDCSIGVVQANIWNTSPNISAAIGNNNFTFTTSVAPAGVNSLTIPDGLYSVDGLNSYLSVQLVNLGYPPNLITIGANDATGKSVVTFLTSGDSVNFTVVTSVRPILGFNSVVITAPSANYSFYSNNTAQFNRVNSYIISSNLVANGIQVNSSPQGIIATIPISVPPGSQINYSPQNVIWFSGNELIGQQKGGVQFNLLDQDLRPTDTGGETWAFTMLIKTQTLLSSGTLPLRP